MNHVPKLGEFVYFSEKIGEPPAALESVGYVVYRSDRCVEIVSVGFPKESPIYFIRSIYNIEPVEPEKAMILKLEQ